MSAKSIAPAGFEDFRLDKGEILVMRSWVKGCYRSFQRHWVKPFLLPNHLPQKKPYAHGLAKKVPKEPGEKRIWFHAASVGELESLSPVVLDASEKGSKLILTVFSPSAEFALKKLKQEILQQASSSNPILMSGYSPWEGEWGQAISSLRPDLFVTAKYEAWPELWIALKDEGIPLGIVSAQKRLSLKVARRACTLLSGGLPELFLFSPLESDQEGLRRLFPQAQIWTVGEPRWDRVMARARAGNLRAGTLIQTASSLYSLERPWGIVGSAWIEDLQFLKPILEKVRDSTGGTLWIVPHRVDAKNIAGIEAYLNAFDLRVSKTSGSSFFNGSASFAENSLAENSGRGGKKRAPQCILVDEMGFLSELYSVADWVFVGGGFGQGIHSTIEPAIYGVPIAGGPKGVQKFSEIQVLRKSGQFSCLKTRSELEKWFQGVLSIETEKSKAEKSKWIQEAQDRCGVSKKILSILSDALELSK